jgi:anti-anti-sigma factor
MAPDLRLPGPFDVPAAASAATRPQEGGILLVSVIRLAGEQDSTTVDELRAQLDLAGGRDPHGQVEVDMSAVTFISCEPLRALAQTKIVLTDRFRLTAVSPPVRRLLDLTGLDQVLGPVPVAEDPPVQEPEASALSLLAEVEAEVIALREATQSRANIEQAKGLLMGINGCDAEHAWSLMIRAASGAGVRIRDLARAVTDAAAGEPDAVSPAVRAAMRDLSGATGRDRGPR